ncbi:hypothetical protein OGAPHI_007066 [Ogataea philodendri]|uniref:Iron-sulfur cluster biogenesis chaperone, mitochondrial n=1 Tax=Ogataea philodendri TaxID=1378263 RepID=A0A9P8NVI6_9ASCO|nr:uncharacterized protein OGAPHI_007066 [Ogataea philodendri]KAH3660480.1 hypothetical protein OGAPHI_007066 [Ogataea philodendri]
MFARCITRSGYAGFFLRKQIRQKSGQIKTSKVIGIDLGTTNSAVAVVEGDKPKILENQNGDRTTPSIVAFTKDGDVLVGNPAKRQSVVNHTNTFYATKRLIGRKYHDKEVQKDIGKIPYKICEHRNGDAWLQTSIGGGQAYSPSQISGFVLREMKKIAEHHLEAEVNNSVITVPAYFNDAQRQATKAAGELVGLNVIRVINEPTAASLAYGIGTKGKNDGIVAVYDLGGGTFDISILDIEDGVFEVRSTNGDTHLGGEDVDNILVEFILSQFKEQSGIDLAKDKTAIQRIRQACEKAKIDLSHSQKTVIELPFITSTESISITLTEKELDNMCEELIEKTMAQVRKALKDADLKPADINDVILVGGMTRMPKIRSEVAQFFGKKPSTKINPDEAVALGAAIQGAVLSGEVENVLLLDVTPLTLGIETYGGMFSPLLPRNTSIPCRVTQLYSTAIDGQSAMDINVYQGERPLVQDNTLIGNFKLTDIPPMPKGTPQIEVMFDIDADGIIKVTAKDKNSGKKSSITVFGKSGLTKEEIEHLVDESKHTAKQDQEKLSILRQVNNLELVIFDTEQALEGVSRYVDDESRDTVHHKLKEIKAVIKDFRSGGVQNQQIIKKMQEDLQSEALDVIRKAVERSINKVASSKVSMYNHPNLSTSSTGSYSKRLSSNNPFRSALLLEETRMASEDSNYKRWLEKHTEENDDSDDENYPPPRVNVKPKLYATNSESSM